MKKFGIALLLLQMTFVSFSQEDLSYFLPENVTYNQSIPKPKEIIGHEIGEWHITHDRLVNYMKVLAESSPRITLEQFGTTHEGRPQILLTITSQKNHAKIDEIKASHRLLCDPDKSGSLNLSNMPAVVWQGFSIHGNEPSGSNASMITAYHYAAAQGDEIDNLLENLVILLDPSFNPDGLTRFSTWVNSRKSKNLVTDPNNMEQNEYWPRGRTNHYWFDLNRDWLPVQQPEARNRIRKYHEWKPNVLTDHHEMGTNSTFFFQPGIPSRNNPNTPANTFVLTEKIAKYHAAALDKIGSLYYSKENYDDFYYGKGSTFPDINGGVGILFEQASSRSHAQESDHGIIRFPFTIRNQFVTSLSTTKAAVELREELLEHQRTFFKTGKNEASQNVNKGIIFGSKNDPSRAKELADILVRHDIKVYKISKYTTINQKEYPENSSYIVPMDQYQYKLIDIMFQKVTSFQDSLFYDVSAWTFPLSFNLTYEQLNAKQVAALTEGKSYVAEENKKEAFAKSEYAYAFRWDDYYAPKLLWKLLDRGILCKVSHEQFHAEGNDFDKGSIMIPVSLQIIEGLELYELLDELSNNSPVKIKSLSSGDAKGINLGSPKFDLVKKPSIALLVEEGVSSSEAGEVWHLLDNRFDIPVSLIPIRILSRVDMDRYNKLIMVSGNYSDINTSATEKIKNWVRDGGTIIALKSANNWLKQNEMVGLETVASHSDNGVRRPYEDLDESRGAQATGGSIFTGNLDVTNPIGYGYSDSKLPVFVNNNTFYKVPSNPYAMPFQFSRKPLESGYISNENLERIKETAGIIVSSQGRGRIVSFSFNPNFRAFWFGTNKLFLNAIFFGDLIDGRSTAK